MPSQPTTYPQMIVIGGPTASGKSDLATILASQNNGVVINADSMQLYRDIPILSGTPDAAAMEMVPHRLYGVLPMARQCSMADWVEMALSEIKTAIDAGKLPIVVGGTGLYLNGLTDGVSPMPDVTNEVRGRVRDMLQTDGVDALYRELQSRDPVMAGRLRPRDPQRISRALEMILQTGRSLAEFQGQKTKLHAYRHKTILLLPPRAELYRRVNLRFDKMMELGALEEARAIESSGIKDTVTSLKAKGIPELRAHLRGEIGLDDAVQIAKTKTRQYAKRQYTWFRNHVAGDIILDDFIAPGQLSAAAMDIFGALNANT